MNTKTIQKQQKLKCFNILNKKFGDSVFEQVAG